MASSNSQEKSGLKFGISFGLICTFSLFIMFFLSFAVSSATPDDKIFLEIFPQPNKKLKDSFIHIKPMSKKNYTNWSRMISSHLDVYRNPKLISNTRIKECTFDNPPKNGEICNVDVKNWDHCNSENYYNYHRASPCIFLKFNEPNNWTPRYYKNTDELPDDMPQDLKAYIQHTQSSKNMNNIWVSCEGDSPTDKENIGPINYFPNRGFPGYFFPSENVNGYLSPLIAISFEKPLVGVTIRVVCKAWAPDIGDRGKAYLDLLVNL